MIEPALEGRSGDRRGQGMLARLLQAGGEADQLGLILAGDGHDGSNPGLSLRQRAGLVEDQRVDFFESLEGLGVLHQHAGSAPRPVPTMIDIGVASPSAHGQAMIRTATALTSAWASRGSGPMIAQVMNVTTATSIDGRDEVGRDLVGQALDRRAGPPRLADHPDDLGQHRLGADAIGPHDQAAGPVDRAADDPVPRPLLDRDRLARDHRLVHRAGALDHDAVDRDLLPGPDPESVARLTTVQRDVLLAAVVAEPSRSLGSQPEEGTDRTAGLATSPKLEHLAQQDERRDDRRRLEVHRDRAVVVAERIRKDAWRDRRDDAEQEGRPRSPSRSV